MYIIVIVSVKNYEEVHINNNVNIFIDIRTTLTLSDVLMALHKEDVH